MRPLMGFFQCQTACKKRAQRKHTSHRQFLGLAALLYFGVEGFEPPTSCSQSRRATRLRYTPLSCLIDEYQKQMLDHTHRFLYRQSFITWMQQAKK